MGDREGARIPRLYKENITIPEIITELDTLIGRWAQMNDHANEGFGDFTIRAGTTKPVVKHRLISGMTQK